MHFRLKTSKQKSQLISSLIDAWLYLRNNEQSMLTEAIEQLSINSELASSILKILQDACDKLKSQSEFTNVHALLLVDQKFLSLYSSKNSHDLCPSDILLMMLMCWTINGKKSTTENQINNIDENDEILLYESNSPKQEEVKPFGAKLSNPTSEDISNLFSKLFFSVKNERFGHERFQ